MKVLVLAAGYGTRLYPLVKDTPKALLDIKGKPLLNYTLKLLKDLPGLNEIIVVTNNKFYTHFTSWSQSLKYPHKITVVNDKTETPEDRLGSIGDINFVLEQYPFKDDLLILGGDNLFDYNVDDYIRFAQGKKAPAIGLYNIHSLEEATKFGVVVLDANKKVISFEEKPEKPKSTLVGMCFYYLPEGTLSMVKRYIEETGQTDKAGHYIKWLCGQCDVYGFEFTGSWYDIGSVESYQEAQQKFKGCA